MQQDELLFVVDAHNNPRKPKPRSLVHSRQLWHRTAHIWVVNKFKQLLCHQQSILKDIAPGKWEPYFNEHLPPNISFKTGALQEFKKEVGLKIQEQALHLYRIYRNKTLKEFEGIFVYVWDGKSEMLTFAENEIAQLKWMPLREVQQIVTNKTPGWTQIEYAPSILKNLGKLK
jgi:isopentenyl-diphosphate Delta-isomerase